MSPEKTSAGQQEAPERLPSRGEIGSAFEAILQGKEYKELRFRADANEVQFYEIEVVLEDGERREYNYKKASFDYRATWLPAASIHVTTYDADGMPYGGDCVANYRDGTWQYFPETP